MTLWCVCPTEPFSLCDMMKHICRISMNSDIPWLGVNYSQGVAFSSENVHSLCLKGLRTAMDHAQSTSLLEHGLQPGDCVWEYAHSWDLFSRACHPWGPCLHLHPNALYVAAMDIKTENKGGKEESPWFPGNAFCFALAWRYMSFPNSYVEIPAHRTMLPRGESLEMWLHHENRTLNGTNVLIKENIEVR